MFGKTMRIGNIVLKAYTLTDITSEECLRGLSDHEVTQYTLQHSAATKEGEEKWYEIARESQNDVHWGIYLSGKFVGFSSLHINAPNHHGGTGTIIFDKTAWGKGVASQAHIARTWYAVTHLNLLTLTSQVLSPNEASKRALEKVGYIVTGTHFGYDYRNGEYVDRFYLQWIKPSAEDTLLASCKSIPKDVLSQALKRAAETLKKGGQFVKYQ